jgi:hypothetical protein
MPAESWDRERFHDYVSEKWDQDEAPGVILVVERWIARGDGAAVYENHDLGHPDVGMPRIASYGSPAAQLETDTPPERLPDTLKDINWRYLLIATYRGEPVESSEGEQP